MPHTFQLPDSQYRVHLRRFLVFVGIAISMLAVDSHPSRGQQSLGIAAVVNDEMISVLDITSRLKLAIALSRLPDTSETRRRLAPQALRNLIDDKIKLQEAKRLDIKVSPAELNRAIADTERRSGIKRGMLQPLMKRLGIDKAVIMEQMEAQVSWAKVVSRRFGRSVTITDQDIDDLIAETNKRVGQLEYLVSEIFLPVENPTRLQEVSVLANRLIQEIKSGANFGAVARNFSQSPTAAVNGSLGWTRIDQLPKDIGKVIETLPPGQVSAPIRSLDGINIVLLLGKRKIEPFGTRKPPPPKITLFQLLFPLPKGGDAAAVDRQARELSASARSCQDMQALAKRINSPLSGNLGKLNVGQLASQVRNAVIDLPVGQPSAPVVTATNVIVFMVCDREKAAVIKTDEKSIRGQAREILIDQRLGLAGRRHLRSLRRSAIVDIRL